MFNPNLIKVQQINNGLFEINTDHSQIGMKTDIKSVPSHNHQMMQIPIMCFC